MTEPTSHLNLERDRRLGEILDEYLAAAERGQPPSRDEIFLRHPELADELSVCLESLEFLGKLSPAAAESVADTTANQIIGESLGDFQIVRELGRGGMGIVYEAEQRSLGRRVALKILPFAAILQATRLARFQQEVRTAAVLHHPHIVSVYGCGVERGVHYYAMQYIEGESLAQTTVRRRLAAGLMPPDSMDANSNMLRSMPRRENSGQAVNDTVRNAQSPLNTVRLGDETLNVRDVAQLGLDAALTLQHVHDLGIIHRDIKPSNLLVDVPGHLWLTDFGLARFGRDAGLTASGDLVGTLRYMSPEQASGGTVAVDHRTDIYSLGATLYEVLTLEPVAQQTDRTALLQEISQRMPTRPRSINRRIPGDLETIILKALAKDPIDRYATAQQMADDLRRFLESRPIQARPLNPLQRTWRWYKRSPMVAGLLTAVLLLSLLMLGTVALFGQREYRQRVQAEQSARDARWRQYVSDMHSGVAAWENNDIQQTIDLVNRHWPEPGGPDHRGFEWYYLWKQTHPDDDTITLRHEGDVWAVAFSPDGKLVASGGFIGRPIVRLWNAKTGKSIHDLSGHTDSVLHVLFSPDSKSIVSCSYDGTARLWDVETGRLIHVLRGHEHHVGVPLFFDEGRKLAAGGWDASVRVWDVTTGQQTHVLPGVGNVAAPIAAVSSQQLIVGAGNYDYGARLWDLSTNTVLRTLMHRPLAMPVVTLPTSNNGRTALVPRMDGTVRTYDFEADKELEVIATSRAQITTIDWAQNRNWLAIGTATGTIALWDITTKTLLSELRGHLHGVTRVAILPDGSRLASASRDGTVKIWNLDRTPPLPVLHLIGSTLSIDRHNRVAVVRRRGHVELVEIASRKHRLILQKGFNDINAVFSPADDILAMSTGDGTVSLSRVPSFEGELSQTAIEIGNQGLHLAFSPDGRLLVCGGHEQQVVVYDLAAGRILRKLSLGATGDISDLSFVGSSNRLAVAVTDLRVVIVDPTTDERISEIRTNTSNSFIDVSRDGQVLAVGDWKAPLSLWSIATGEQLKSIENATGIQDVTFSPDGILLATAGQDFHVRLWDVATGEQRAIFRGHTAHVQRVAFSSHGDYLISSGYDGALFFWQAATPREVEAAEGLAKNASRLRARGESVSAASLLKSHLETRSAVPDSLWDEWFEVNAIDLRRSAREILADWPRTRNEAPSRGTDMREVLEQLESKGIIRINCGGDDYQAADGTLWSRDRCWVDGSQAENERPVEGTEDDPWYHSERWFHTTSKPFGYSIPVPPGRYTATLHFAEMLDRQSIAERRFDVLVESEEVLKNYQPPLFTVDSISITVNVIDGFLNVRFRHRIENPKISAIEIRTSH